MNLTRSMVLVAIMFLLNDCARNPVSGRRQMVLMSEEQEIAMGKEADPQILQVYGLYEDKKLQDFINAEGKKMGAISHRPNLEYHFRIVDSDIINAFAVPGGYVYFTRGIMAHFNNEAEFAGVLGHEIGHITARHSVIQQRNAVLGQVGLIAGIVLRPELAQFADAASQGLGLLFMKFGRDDERESDELGVEYSTKTGYDAREMADFFKTLERKQAESGAGELPNFLSTHPNPGERFETVGRLAKEWQRKENITNAEVNRNEYLRRIEGLIYGEDPKQGFLEGGTFYHPVLKFQFPVPQGWSYQNSPSQVQMAQRDGRALLILMMARGANVQEAASAAMQQYSLRPLESREITVNGLQALAVVADQQSQQQQQQQQQQQVVRTLSYFIKHGENIYHLIGLSSGADFASFNPVFTNSMQNFRPVTDQNIINRKPERVTLKTVNQNTTLQQALKSFGVADARLEEIALLNGMLLNDRVPQGTLLKVVERR